MTKFPRLPRGALAGGFLVALVAVAVLAPILPIPDPLAQDLLAAKAKPSAEHWLGTDILGRDLLGRMIFGAREVIVGAVESLVVAFAIGGIAGLTAGYTRGTFDTVSNAVADMLQSVPAIAILLSVLAVFEGNIHIAMVVFGILASGAIFRIVRASTLAIAEERYIVAARLSGLSTWQIVTRHLASRLRSILIVQASIVLSLAIVNQVGLSFLGLGSRPPSPTWGTILLDASSLIFSDPWMIVPPALAIILTILSLLALGDVFQDAATAQVGRGSAVRPATRFITHVRGQPAEAGTILDVRNLTIAVSLGDHAIHLVQDVSFKVRAGQTVGLVGESGAGKSVSARSALGMFPSSGIVSGSVQVDGIEVADGDTKRLEQVRGRKVGFIAQQPMAALDPAFTIGQLLDEAVQTHQGLSRKQARQQSLALLRDVLIRDPEQVVLRYPHEISGGMAQRVGIAMALAGNPILLVADEPTTALDVTVQREILSLLRQIQQKRGLAILLVTHDWGVVADMCDEVITFYAGQIVETAPVDEIFASPKHPYTAALRAADPHAQESTDRLSVIPGQVPPPGRWPAGCHFQDRCPLSRPACGEQPIPIVAAGPNHSSRCLFPEKVQPREQAA